MTLVANFNSPVARDAAKSTATSNDVRAKLSYILDVRPGSKTSTISRSADRSPTTTNSESVAPSSEPMREIYENTTLSDQEFQDAREIDDEVGEGAHRRDVIEFEDDAATNALLDYIGKLRKLMEEAKLEIPAPPSTMQCRSPAKKQTASTSKQSFFIDLERQLCGGCGAEGIARGRCFVEAGKVYCSACWCAWERCGWWRPSIRVLSVPPPLRNGKPYYVAEDAFMIPAFCCPQQDKTLFEALKSELPAGRDFSDWHGGRHLGVQFQGEKDGARHNGENEPPALKATVAMLEKAFGIEASASRLNLYRTSDDYKPLHCDRGRDEDGVPQITVGASFGATRELTMVHIKSGVAMTFPQKNGDVFAFTPELNSLFTHGVPKIGYGSPSEFEGSGERLSLILWGSKVTPSSTQLL